MRDARSASGVRAGRDCSSRTTSSASRTWTCACGRGPPDSRRRAWARPSLPHEGSASIGRASPKRIYYATRNHLLLAARVSPPGPSVARWIRTASIVALNLAFVLTTTQVPRRKGLSAFRRGLADHRARPLRSRCGRAGGNGKLKRCQWASQLNGCAAWRQLCVRIHRHVRRPIR